MQSILGRLLFTGVILAGGATAAAAQANHFRGNACVVTATSACAAVGVTVGACSTARFRPPNYNGQANSTKLSLFGPYHAQNFTLPTGSLVGATFKSVNAMFVGQTATPYTALARIAAQTPPTPAATTIYLTATVDINGFDSEAPSCNVRLLFQGQRYPF